MILFILQSNYPQVSGVVRDQLTLLPVAGAMVTLQTTNIKTITAADGSFVLTNAIGADLVIVSAKKYYYNKSVTVSSPITNVEILIESVPQDNNPNYNFMDPEVCGSCHPDQYDQWTGSPMSLAGVNAWVYDTYNGRNSGWNGRFRLHTRFFSCWQQS